MSTSRVRQAEFSPVGAAIRYCCTGVFDGVTIVKSGVYYAPAIAPVKPRRAGPIKKGKKGKERRW